jgi:hypothetical protein
LLNARLRISRSRLSMHKPNRRIRMSASRTIRWPIAAGLMAILFAGCATSVIDGQWADTTFSGRSLLKSRVLVSCRAPDVSLARTCEDNLASGLRDAGVIVLRTPEPIDAAGGVPAVLSAALAGRRTPIKAALLDQKIVAGLGNIYVSEALFRAGISPKRLAATVAGARAARLVPAIQAVLAESIAAGGSSLRDYVQADGGIGFFQDRFKVYDRAGEPCDHCPGPPGCDGIRRLVQAGRASFHCPRVQR